MDVIRLSPEGVMLRPLRGDLCVRMRAAEMALPEVKQWIGPTSQTDAQLVEELAKYVGGWDGYEIVRAMERDGWCGNAELVEIMDSGWIRNAERELTRQWVRCLAKQRVFADGDEVSCAGITGKVVGYEADLHLYRVHSTDQPPNQWHVFNAEDVVGVL